jgi:hypothetical protein
MTVEQNRQLLSRSAFWRKVTVAVAFDTARWANRGIITYLCSQPHDFEKLTIMLRRARILQERLLRSQGTVCLKVRDHITW